MFRGWGACSFQPHLQPRWVYGSGTDPKPSQSPHHPSAVGVNVKLHPFPTRQSSPSPPPTTLHISRFSKFHKCHFIMRLSSLWRPPHSLHPFNLPLRSHCSQFFFPLSSLFYLSAPLPGNPVSILPSVFAVKKPHNWISYICLFWFFFSPPPLTKTAAIRDARREGEFNTQITQRLKQK